MGEKRPRPGVRVQRDWKRPGLPAVAPLGIGDLWLWLRLRFLDDEGCFANGADNWVAAQVVKHVLAVFTKSLCSALFHNYEAISNRMNRWPFSMGGKDAGAHQSQVGRADDKRPPCPVSVALGEVPHQALGLSVAQEGSAFRWPLFYGGKGAGTHRNGSGGQQMSARRARLRAA